MERDKYGNYVNDKGVKIKVVEDKQGKDHISFYDGPVDGEHSAVHVNIDYDKGKWTTNTHGEGHSNTDKPCTYSSTSRCVCERKKPSAATTCANCHLSHNLLPLYL